MLVGNITPIITPPVQKIDYVGMNTDNGGVVPPWLTDPFRILPWPWPAPDNGTEVKQ